MCLHMAFRRASAYVGRLTRFPIAAALMVLLFLRLPASVNGQGNGDPGHDHESLVIYVDSELENGANDSCLYSHTGAPRWCTSLEAIASGITSMENLTKLEIVIRSPQLELKEPVKFEGLSVVRIVGAPTQIRCVSNSSTETSGNSTAGVVFVAIGNLLIENVMFEYCGAFYNYPKDWEGDYWKAFRAAIHIFNSTNILVRSIAVSASNGAGMAVSNVHGGTLNVSDSLFDHNAIPESDRASHAGGGGIFVQVYFDYSEFVFTNCTFVNNAASATYAQFYTNIFGALLIGRGQGGGLLVNVLDDASNNTIKITKCNFIRNSAFFGGGLVLWMFQRTQNNLAVVSSSYFEENGCHRVDGSHSWSGGGLHLGYNDHGLNGKHMRDNRIVIKDSVITRNCGETGGGVTFFSSRSDFPNTNNRLCFINCSWIENSGRYGAAIDILPHTEETLSAGFLPTPEFIDCKFINNSAALRTKGFQQVSGTGILFSSQLNIKFTSSVLFERNTDSALVVVNAVANFSSCSATFVNNTGVQGGAISLVGISSMVIGPGHVYMFHRNKATDRGGAISSYLIDENDLAASRSCFMQYASERVQPTEWNSTLTFVGNEAPIGKSIFTTSITPCLLNAILLSPEAELNQSVTVDPREVFHWPGVFTFDDPSENQIATDGAHFGILGKVPFEIIPGEEHLLQVNITDDLGQLVDTTLRATIDDQEKSDIEIDAAFSYVEDKHVKLRGEERDTGALLLQFVSPRKTSILLDFVLVPCPVGYSLNSEKECECDVNSYEGLTKCNTSGFTSYIRKGFWVGYRGDSLMTGICPVGFCHYNYTDESADILLPQNSSELDDFICGPSRTGVLCGDCKDGYSAFYHSPYFRCRENSNLCSIGWVLYILSELVPATILFIFFLLLKIRFTSGKLNGFIFFSQLLSTLFVDATDVIKVPDAVHVLSWGYHIIYGFFSLDFFTIEPLSFCLWEGATVLDVLAFKYVTIAYSLILVILVVVFMRYSARRLFGNYVKISAIQDSVIHGLSAFLVLCYMQCIKVSLKILLSKPLQGRGGTLLSPARVWFSGEIEVFSPDHLPYAFPALLCLLTLGVIPPMLLLVYPLNNKIMAFLNITKESQPRLSDVLSLDKLMPIFNSFQGCFKDKLRFFAGLYFVYRWVGLFAYAVSPNFSIFYTVLELFLIFILMIHALAQPYKQQRYNVLDVLLLTDLALINMLTVFNYYYTRVTAEEVRDQQVIDFTSSFQLILIYLPILVMCVCLLAKGIKKYCTSCEEANNEDGEEEELDERDPPQRDPQEDQWREPLLNSTDHPRPTYGI